MVTVNNVNDYSFTEVFQGENPNFYVPDLGTLQFFIKVGATTGAWSEPLRVQCRRQFIPCPWEGGASLVQGTPRLGVEWTLTPIYGAKGVPVQYP